MGIKTKNLSRTTRFCLCLFYKGVLYDNHLSKSTTFEWSHEWSSYTSLTVIAKLSKFVQISMQTSSDSFSLPDCVLLPKTFMMSWHSNIWKFKIWLSQEWKELSKWNKKHFSLFPKCSLSDKQNKLAKM